MIAHAGRRAIKVISGLQDPLGLAWFQGRLYVASVGRVDAFAGFDGQKLHVRTKVLSGPVPGGETTCLRWPATVGS